MNKDKNYEPEAELNKDEIEELMQKEREERLKQLKRHKLPAKATLAEALTGLTKLEIEDIQYNLNLPMAANINRIKKEDMVKAVLPEIISFAGRWFVSVIREQKELFDYLAAQEEPVELQLELEKLNYLSGIGLLYCGSQKGKLLWYMPEEIKEEYGKINNNVYRDMVEQNTEIMNLSAGLVYFYGVMEYDKLHEKVKSYIEDELEFSEFMGIMFNGACWYPHVMADKYHLHSAHLINIEELLRAQEEYGLEYAELPYDKVFEAGDEHYIDSTPAYRALAQYLMNKRNLDVLQAANEVKMLMVLMQNGYGMKEIIASLKENKLLNDSGDTELYGLIGRYNTSLRLWMLRGHNVMELEKLPAKKSVKRDKKVGRNEPCPCGSGKKYKHCCLN